MFLRLLLCLLACIAYADQRFVAISDIHFDPFFGCSPRQAPCPLVTQLIARPVDQWSALLKADDRHKQTNIRMMQDSQNALFVASIKQLSHLMIEEKADFVIATGDFVAHHMQRHYRQQVGSLAGYQTFINKVFAYVHRQLLQASHGKPIYWVMGNNDGYWGDYVFKDRDPFYQMIFNRWQIPMTSKSSFLARGEYAFSLSPEVDAVVLNSVIYAKETHGDTLKGSIDSLNFLERQLLQAETHHHRLVIFYHIPYGTNPAKVLFPLRYRSNWTAGDSERFLSLMQRHQATVLAIIHGHLHRQLFAEQQKDSRHPLPQQLVPSVSPIFGNHPAVAVFILDHHGLREEIVPVRFDPLATTA